MHVWASRVRVPEWLHANTLLTLMKRALPFDLDVRVSVEIKDLSHLTVRANPMGSEWYWLFDFIDRTGGIDRPAKIALKEADFVGDDWRQLTFYKEVFTGGDPVYELVRPVEGDPD